MSLSRPPKSKPRFPVREGVGASVIALPESDGDWHTILDYLVERFPNVSREEIIVRMARGDVFDDGGALIAPSTPYQAHRKLYYYRHVEDEPRIPFEEAVLFQDELIVVADKPHFLPATPGGRYVQETLLTRLRRRLGIDSLAPMHRLDRETAGLMLFTVQPSTRARYAALFAAREVQKRYEAIAPTLSIGTIVRKTRIESADHFMCVKEVDGEPNAETVITKLDSSGGFSRYRLEPHTGKKHQLRVQMCGLGAPIMNDQMYPTLVSKEELERDDYTRPLQLLAQAIAFRDPITGAERSFTTQQSLSFGYT